MGATYVTVTIPHPAEPHRAWEGLFLLGSHRSHRNQRLKRLPAVRLKSHRNRS